MDSEVWIEVRWWRGGSEQRPVEPHLATKISESFNSITTAHNQLFYCNFFSIISASVDFSKCTTANLLQFFYTNDNVRRIMTLGFDSKEKREWTLKRKEMKREREFQTKSRIVYKVVGEVSHRNVRTDAINPNIFPTLWTLYTHFSWTTLKCKRNERRDRESEWV
jgi:hypothetical protein